MTRFHTVILFFSLPFISYSFPAQDYWWVYFRDKDGVSFNPRAYFNRQVPGHQCAPDLPLWDFNDLPVNEGYIRSVAELADSTGYASRWLNALFIRAGKQEVRKIRRLGCVLRVEHAGMSVHSVPAAYDTSLKETDLWLLAMQTEMIGGYLFREHGIDGRGVRIAVFDGGFPAVNTSPVFSHLREENRIIETWDFVRNREDVYAHIAHGTMVLSCIAGKFNGRPMGLAQGAEYLLAITERHGEPFSEEENWLAAMEWAHRNGAQIINSSLGYTRHRYFRQDMNGQTSLVAKAARIAARKGMLVVNAMGNDGWNRWEIAGTPADVDSVLSVGGIDPYTGYHIYFSSYGPTASGLQKPNVSAPASVMAAGRTGIRHAYGTSFSAPLVTGFAACVLQKHPELNSMELMRAVEQSGHLYPYFDYAHGYGLPQASVIMGTDTAVVKASFTFRINDDHLEVVVTGQEKECPGIPRDQYLYYHIAGPGNRLVKYSVIGVQDEIPLKIPLGTLNKDCIIRVHYRGYTGEFGT